MEGMDEVAGERAKVGEGMGEGAWTGELGAEDFSLTMFSTLH